MLTHQAAIDQQDVYEDEGPDYRVYWTPHAAMSVWQATPGLLAALVGRALSGITLHRTELFGVPSADPLCDFELAIDMAGGEAGGVCVYNVLTANGFVREADEPVWVKVDNTMDTDSIIGKICDALIADGELP